MKNQKIQKPKQKQVAIEGEGVTIKWTDAEDISENNWKEKISKVTEEVTETFKGMTGTIKIIIITSIAVTLIIIIIIISIIVTVKVKRKRRIRRTRRFNTIKASAPYREDREMETLASAPCCDTRDEAIAKTLRSWQK